MQALYNNPGPYDRMRFAKRNEQYTGQKIGLGLRDEREVKCHLAVGQLLCAHILEFPRLT